MGRNSDFLTHRVFSMRERGEMNHPSNHPLARPLSRRYRRPAGRIRSKLEESPFLRKQKNDEVRFQPFALQVSRELSDLRSFDASSKLSSSRRSSSRNEDRQGFASPLSIDKINKPPNDGICRSVQQVTALIRVVEYTEPILLAFQ